MSDGDDSSAQNTRAYDVGSLTWMPIGGKRSDDALGVWLSRHGLELVHRPHQASCFTEDATVAFFCKAYKSMIESIEADLSSGRLSLRHVFTLLSMVKRTHKTFVHLPPCVGLFPARNVDGVRVRVRVTASATSGRGTIAQ